MNKPFLSAILIFSSFLSFSQAKKGLDSLAGFDYAGALEHASHCKTEKEKRDFMDHAKRTYKIAQYDLKTMTVFANGTARAGSNTGVVVNGSSPYAKPPGGNNIMQGPQPAGCSNIDFEAGNISNWAVTGDYQVTSGGTDPYGGFPKVFPGGSNSLRLNDDNITSKTTFSATATRVIPVSAANNQFQLHFAFDILNYPHPGNAAAIFQIQFFNASNTQLACPTFTCYFATPPGTLVGMPAGTALTSSVTGKNIGNQTFPVTYVPWQTVAMDLSLYNGQNITVKITCNWCLYNYDWGYCYIDADCAPNIFVPTNNPCGPMPQTLCGPIGMASYTWTPPVGSVVTSTCITATTAGVYTLQCTPFTTCAALQTYTFSVGGAPPVANFISAPACINSATGFTSTSMPGGSPINNYSWTWGDGSPTQSGTVTALNHTYTTAGPKPVKLVVTNQAGCKDSITINVSPVNSPIAAFNYTTACVNSKMTFQSTTNLNGGPSISNYVWTWSDGTPNGSNPGEVHTYTTSTPKTVQLVVTNSSGCKDSITKNFNINPAPIVNWNANNVCFGVPTSFNNMTNLNGSTIASWNWDLNGDLVTDNTNQSPSLIYPNSGTFNAGLIAMTNLGCSDTLYQLVQVYSKPVARFGYTKTCLGDFTQFYDNSYVIGSNGVLNMWGWDIDNNLSTFESTVQNAMILYPNSGQQTTNLVVSTTYGCKDTATMNIFVNVYPNIDFIADRTAGCAPLPVSFTNKSTISVGSIDTYSWNLGNGTATTETNIATTYAAGVYTVSLIATSDSGCTSKKVIKDYINSYPSPVADYTVSPQTTDILEPLVNFTNLTASGTFSNFYWYFGDKPAADSVTQHPSHYYDSDFSGQYMTTLIVSNSHGCTDTTQRLVVINPNYVIYVPNAFTPNGDGINDIFYAKGYYIDKFDMMIFDRWGELVFVANDIHKGWDGTVKGKLGENATYVWKIVTVDSQKKRRELTGHITLIK